MDFKERFNKNRKLNITILVIFILSVIFLLGYSYYSVKKYERNIEILIKNDYYGKIDSFGNGGRGSLLLIVKQDGKYIRHNFMGKFHYAKLLNKGDSVYKSPNSSILNIYDKYHQNDSLKLQIDIQWRGW
jgi:hypothetical protein